MVKRKEEIKISNTTLARYCYAENFTNEFEFCKKLPFWEHKTNTSTTYPNDRKVLDHVELEKLKSFFTKCIKDYANNILKDSDLKFWIFEAWSCRQDYNLKIDSHCHCDANLVGVFYLNVPDNSTPIIFDKFSVDVNTADLILFSGDLKHSVEKNKNKKARYCISFTLVKK